MDKLDPWAEDPATGEMIHIGGTEMKEINLDPTLDPERRMHNLVQRDSWANEREDVLRRFMEELRKATGDGSKKRQAGTKPPWYIDRTHEAAIFSHLCNWKRGELLDKDSGAHALVHCAWRCLAVACREIGNYPHDLRKENQNPGRRRSEVLENRKPKTGQRRVRRMSRRTSLWRKP
jgi:hypothetical protein